METPRNSKSPDFERQLRGFRLTTANILYHLPDFPALLQSYVWQDFDLAPAYPKLTKFLDFWSANLDGKLHSVQVAGRSVISAAEIESIGLEMRLH